MSGWWLVSYLVLWALVVVLGIIVLVVLRQLGLIYARDASMTTLRGPRVGDMFGSLKVRDDLTGESIDLPDGDESLSLMILVSPACDMCKDALYGIEALKDGRSVSIVAVSAGDIRANESLRAVLDDGARLLSSEELHHVLSPPTIPWALLVDRRGTVLESRPVNRHEDLRGMLNARDRAPAENPSRHAEEVH